MSRHSASSFVGWPVNRLKAFTFIVNPSGVRSTQPLVSSGRGGK